MVGPRGNQVNTITTCYSRTVASTWYMCSPSQSDLGGHWPWTVAPWLPFISVRFGAGSLRFCYRGEWNVSFGSGGGTAVEKCPKVISLKCGGRGFQVLNCVKAAALINSAFKHSCFCLITSFIIPGTISSPPPSSECLHVQELVNHRTVCLCRSPGLILSFREENSLQTPAHPIYNCKALWKLMAVKIEGASLICPNGLVSKSNNWGG